MTKEINEQIMLFADDSYAFMTNKDLNQLKLNSEKLFAKLEEWFAANKRTINVDKTNFNIFHPPRKKNHKNLMHCT